MLGFLKNFFDEKKFFMATVKVSSYIPGRIRCYSTLIHNNQENAELLKEYFSKFKEITNFKVNTVTGSVLIEYDATLVKMNKELFEIEQELIKKLNK